MPAVHQLALMLPPRRQRSCRRPLKVSLGCGRYQLPRPVLALLQAEAQGRQNGEAIVALAVFIARFQTGPRCLGRAFPIDRRRLAEHPALDLSESRVRGAIRALLELGFLQAEAAPPGKRFQRVGEGLQRRALLYRIGPAYREMFEAANRTPRGGPGRAQDGRRAVRAAPVPAGPPRAFWSPPEPGTRSPKSKLQNPTTLPMGERSGEHSRTSLPLAGAGRDPGASRLEEALQRLGEAIRGQCN